MALSPIERPSSPEAQKPRKQFWIYSGTAGSGGTVYTVPAGKSFVGYKVYNSPGTSAANAIWTINGTSHYTPYTTTYGVDGVFPVYLGEGDVVANSGTAYFSLTGYEE